MTGKNFVNFIKTVSSNNFDARTGRGLVKWRSFKWKKMNNGIIYQL